MWPEWDTDDAAAEYVRDLAGNDGPTTPTFRMDIDSLQVAADRFCPDFDTGDEIAFMQFLTTI